MTITRKLGVLAGSAALLVGSACADLEVTNPNNPDVGRALASAEDVLAAANSIPNNVYLSQTFYYPHAAATVAADAFTGNFGNFGMRFHNVEPREAFLNQSAGGDDRFVSQSTWGNAYADLGLANDVMLALKNGITLDSEQEDNAMRALGLYGQAMSLSFLGLYIDQAFIVDENTDLTAAPVLSPYTDVIDAAMEKFDALIALAPAIEGIQYGADVQPLAVVDYEAPLDPITLFPPFTESGMTGEQLIQIANTMAARTLAYSARNGAQTEAVDWGRVLQYAENGISKEGARFDFTVPGDDDKWYSYWNFYNQDPTWLRVDMRIINMMDPTQPVKYAGTVPPEATSADARLEKYFNFEAGVIGDPSRGLYMQSPYSHDRYIWHGQISPRPAQGPAPHVLAAENDLLIAEALVRTNGSLSRAADLINRTRVGAGNLPAATAGEGADQLLDYIYYERMIELLGQSAGQEFLDARRFDTLQPGTQRHWPIPATELEKLALPNYTFGGVGNPDMRRGQKDGLSLSTFGKRRGSIKPIY
jgi:hypothetical protein